MTTYTLMLGNMAPPVPGASPASRLFGAASPADGAGPIGPDQYWPVKSDIPFDDILSSLNPLQHLPGIGDIYRGATGEKLPPPLKIAGALASGFATGNPGGAFGTILLAFGMKLAELGPDRTGPAARTGFSNTNTEAGPEPVSPDLTVPDRTVFADGGTSQVVTMSDYARTQWLEKGFA